MSLLSVISARISAHKLLLIALLALLALLAACAGPEQSARPAAPPPDPAAEANRLLGQGDYAGAADAYAALAGDGQQPGGRNLQAQAALAYQEAGDFARAEAVLGPTRTEGEPPAAHLARARALAHAGDHAGAYAAASGLDPNSLTPYQRGVQARVSGNAALALQNYPVAASALVSAFDYPYPPAAATTLVPSTWSAVSRLGQSELAARLQAADAQAAGWYALALENSPPAPDPASLAARQADWRARYPGHPATSLLEELAKRAAAVSAEPKKVALILPFDATFGVVATAVRDGFLTAWFMDTRPTARPQVQIYSSAGTDVVQVYQRAVSEGAELVVGPLGKDLVDTLSRQPDLPVAVLALNVVEPKPGAVPPPASFFQFGLTPEGEAAQVARHAFARGPRALIMGPSSVFGKRVMTAYASTWQKQGGTVLAQVNYYEDSDAYAHAVKRALNIDLSEARAAALRSTLGVPLQSVSRRRADVDAILLAAYPDNARQLLPQMRFFGADKLPLYATSQVYAGTLDAGRDIDLDGLTFGDMPWLFGAADVESYNLIRRTWPGPMGSYSRFYAFGIDAYRVIPYLSRMRQQAGLRIPGVTGDLWMEPNGVLQRNMTWMKFVNGIPTPTDEAFPAVDGNAH